MISIKRVCYIIKNCFAASPALFIVNACLLFWGSSFILLEAVVPNYVIDKFEKSYEGHSFLAIVCIFAIYIIFYGAVNGITNCFSSMVCDSAYGHNNYKFLLKISKVKAYEFEDHRNLDSIERLKDGADACGFIATIYLSILFFYFPAVVFLLFYYGKTSMLLMGLMCLLVIPRLIVTKYREKLYSSYNSDVANAKRKAKIYKNCFCEKTSVKEKRQYAIDLRLMELWEKSFRYVASKREEIQRRILVGELVGVVIDNGIYVAIIIMLIIMAKQGAIGIGRLTGVVASSTTLSFLIDEIINNNMAVIAENIGNVDYYIEYMSKDYSEYNPQSGSCVALKNVSYRYPESEKLALENITLTIPENSIVAIVGENGSGKTTLSKIIAGLYKPIAGEVYWNNDTVCSVVLQDFVRYFFTIYENIKLGEWNKDNKEEAIEYLNELSFESDVDMERRLGKEYGGTDISGGQWQKLSLVRGVYKTCKLMILDEPTASIDPIMEYDIFAFVKKHSKGKSTIIVTHRLGAVSFADYIIVMRSGRIMMTGTHKELIENCGYYRELYNSQKTRYK